MSQKPPSGATPGEQLAFWRALRGLSQRDLMKAAGSDAASAAQLSRYESNRVSPTTDTLGDLATALGVTILVPRHEEIGKDAPRSVDVGPVHERRVATAEAAAASPETEAAYLRGVETGLALAMVLIEGGSVARPPGREIQERDVFVAVHDRIAPPGSEWTVERVDGHFVTLVHRSPDGETPIKRSAGSLLDPHAWKWLPRSTTDATKTRRRS